MGYRLWVPSDRENIAVNYSMSKYCLTKQVQLEGGYHGFVRVLGPQVYAPIPKEVKKLINRVTGNMVPLGIPGMGLNINVPRDYYPTYVSRLYSPFRTTVSDPYAITGPGCTGLPIHARGDELLRRLYRLSPYLPYAERQRVINEINRLRASYGSTGGRFYRGTPPGKCIVASHHSDVNFNATTVYNSIKNALYETLGCTVSEVTDKANWSSIDDDGDALVVFYRVQNNPTSYNAIRNNDPAFKALIDKSGFCTRIVVFYNFILPNDNPESTIPSDYPSNVHIIRYPGINKSGVDHSAKLKQVVSEKASQCLEDLDCDAKYLRRPYPLTTSSLLVPQSSLMGAPIISPRMAVPIVGAPFGNPYVKTTVTNRGWVPY